MQLLPWGMSWDSLEILFEQAKKEHTYKVFIKHECSSYNLDSLSCLISMLSFCFFPPYGFVNCRMWMQIKLNFDYCCLRQSVASTGEKAVWTSVLLAGAVGIPALHPVLSHLNCCFLHFSIYCVLSMRLLLRLNWQRNINVGPDCS